MERDIERSPSPTPEQFGAHLERLIRERGYSIRGAAREISTEYPGFHVATLRNYIKGGYQKGVYVPPRVPSWEILYRFVRCLGIDPKDLFDFREEDCHEGNERRKGKKA